MKLVVRPRIATGRCTGRRRRGLGHDGAEIFCMVGEISRRRSNDNENNELIEKMNLKRLEKIGLASCRHIKRRFETDKHDPNEVIVRFSRVERHWKAEKSIIDENH